MSKQELIPGGYFANETGARQFLVPGRGYLNENSANVFNDTLPESLTLDFLAQLGAFTYDTLTESLTLVSTWASGNIASFTLSESLTTGFSLNPIILPAQGLFSGGYFFGESATRQFLVPGRGYVNDQGRTRTIYPVSVAYACPLSESLSGDVAFLAANTLSTSINYAISLSDLPPGSPSESSGNSSVLGEATFGLAVYGSIGTSGPNPTYTYPYVYVEFAAGLAEGLTLGDSPGGALFVDQALSFAATASFIPVARMTIDELLLGSRLTKVAARGRTVYVRKET